MKKLFPILILFFASIFCQAQEKTPEAFAKEIIVGVEKASTQNKGRLVLVCFINGSAEIIQEVKNKGWDDEYRKDLETKIVLTIKRGGTLFQLLQILEKEKVLI